MRVPWLFHLEDLAHAEILVHRRVRGHLDHGSHHNQMSILPGEFPLKRIELHFEPGQRKCQRQRVRGSRRFCR